MKPTYNTVTTPKPKDITCGQCGFKLFTLGTERELPPVFDIVCPRCGNRQFRETKPDYLGNQRTNALNGGL